MNKKNFLVSVGQAIGRDPATGEGWFFARTNSSTAFNMTMTAADIRGGVNNILQAVYMHSKEITFDLTKVTFSKAFLALNAGTNVQNKTIRVLQDECHVVPDTGQITLNKTSVTDVSVFLAEDEVITATPNAGVITLPVSYSGQKVTCVYDAMETIDTLEIQADTPPKVVDLTLLIQIRDENMNLVEVLHIVAPKAQATGAYSLNLSADGTSNETLNLKALVSSGESCEDSDKYVDAKWVPVTESKTPISAMLVLNGDISFTISGNAQTVNLKSIGVRSSMYGNIDLTDKTTFAILADPTPVDGLSIAGNVITLSDTATTAGKAFVQATYEGFTDTIAVSVETE